MVKLLLKQQAAASGVIGKPELPQLEGDLLAHLKYQLDGYLLYIPSTASDKLKAIKCHVMMLLKEE